MIDICLTNQLYKIIYNMNQQSIKYLISQIRKVSNSEDKTINEVIRIIIIVLTISEINV